jgi:hypothetical protein
LGVNNFIKFIRQESLPGTLEGITINYANTNGPFFIVWLVSVWINLSGCQQAHTGALMGAEAAEWHSLIVLSICFWNKRMEGSPTLPLIT